MDSGNSGSLQSSSDDHESSSTGVAADHSSFFFPPFSSTFYSNPTTLSSTFYSDPTTLSSSSSTYLNFPNNLIIPNISDHILNQTNLLPPPPPPPPPQPPSSSRNPRKRTRASRRAPTTVLTTDTSNFRAMVQEFTGVPSSPFSTSSLPFSSTTRRFDIFRSPSDPLSFNPFRPTPQKPPILFSSSSSSLLNQYHFHAPLPDIPLPHNHQVSTFQSLLSYQHHHNHQTTTLSSVHNLEALQQHHSATAVDDHHLMMGQFSEFNRPTEKRPEIDDNVASSSSAQIKGSSGTTTTTTTTVDPWICPTDSNILK